MKRKRKGSRFISRSSAENPETHGSSSSVNHISIHNDTDTSTTSSVDDDAVEDDDDDRGSSILRTVFELPPATLSRFRRPSSEQQQQHADTTASAAVATRSDSSRSHTSPNNKRGPARQQNSAIGLSNGSVTHNDDASISDERASRSSADRSSSRRSVLNHHHAGRRTSRSDSRIRMSPEKLTSSAASSVGKSKQKSPPVISSNTLHAVVAGGGKPNGHASSPASSTIGEINHDDERPSQLQRISPVASSLLSQALTSSSNLPSSSISRHHSLSLPRHHHHDAGVDYPADDDAWSAIMLAADAAKSSQSATQDSSVTAAARRSKSPIHRHSPVHADVSHAKRNSTPLSSSKTAARHSPKPEVAGEVAADANSASTTRRSGSPSTTTAADTMSSTTSSRRQRRAGKKLSENPTDVLVDSLSRHFRPKNGKRLRRSSNLDDATTESSTANSHADVSSEIAAVPSKSFTASLKRRKKVMQPPPPDDSQKSDANVASTSSAVITAVENKKSAAERKKKSPLQNKRDRNSTANKQTAAKKTPKNNKTPTVPRAVAALQDYLTPYYSLSSSSEIDGENGGDDESQTGNGGDGGADTVSGSHAPASTFFDSSADSQKPSNSATTAQRRSRRKRKALRRFSLDSHSTFSAKPKILDMQGDLTMQTASSSAAASTATPHQQRLPRDVQGLSDYLTDFFNPATERRRRRPPRRLEDRTPTPPKRAAVGIVPPNTSRKTSKKRPNRRKVAERNDVLPPQKVELTDADFEIFEKFQRLLAESDEKTDAEVDADDVRSRNRSNSSVLGNPVDALTRRKFKSACRLANESIDKVDSLPPPPSPVRMSLTSKNLRSPPTNNNVVDAVVHRPRVRRNNNKPNFPAKSDKIPPDDPNHVINPCPASIQLGPDQIIQCQYQSQYPEEYARCKRLFVCEFCLTYFKTLNIFQRHIRPAPTRRSEMTSGEGPSAVCGLRSPPGREIYRSGDNAYSIFEVCGRQVPTYCTQLCLLAKLFLNHKTVFLDVEPFNFYVMTRNDVMKIAEDEGAENDDAVGRELRHHFVGYFSKERDNPAGWNVSCIVVLPTLQNLGYGRFLIEFSFLLSRQERKPGSPEKPLSEQGERAYKSFYRHVVAKYCLTRLIPQTNSVDPNATLANSDQTATENSQLERHVSFNIEQQSVNLAENDVVGDADVVTQLNPDRKSDVIKASTGNKKPLNAATTPYFTTLNDLQYETGMTLQDIGETLQDLGVFKFDLRNLATAEKKRKKKPKFWLDFSPPQSSSTSWLSTMLNIIRRETHAERNGKRISLDESRLLWQPRIINPHHHFMPFNDVGLRKSALQVRKPNAVAEVDQKADKIKKLKKLHAAAMNAAGKTNKKAVRKPEKPTTTTTDVGGPMATPATRTRRRCSDLAIESAEKKNGENSAAAAEQVEDEDRKSVAVSSSNTSSFVPDDDENEQEEEEVDENDDNEVESGDDESVNEAEVYLDDDESVVEDEEGVDGSEDEIASDAEDDDDEDEQEPEFARRRRGSTRRVKRTLPSPSSASENGSSTVADEEEEVEIKQDDDRNSSAIDDDDSVEAASSVATSKATENDDEAEQEEDDDADEQRQTARNRKKTTVASAARKVNNRNRKSKKKPKFALQDDDENDADENDVKTEQKQPRSSLRLSTRKLIKNEQQQVDGVDSLSFSPHVLRTRRGSRVVTEQA